VLGWKAQFSMDEGLHRTISWYRDFLGMAAPVSQMRMAAK